MVLTCSTWLHIIITISNVHRWSSSMHRDCMLGTNHRTSAMGLLRIQYVDFNRYVDLFELASNPSRFRSFERAFQNSETQLEDPMQHINLGPYLRLRLVAPQINLPLCIFTTKAATIITIEEIPFLFQGSKQPWMLSIYVLSKQQQSMSSSMKYGFLKPRILRLFQPLANLLEYS